MISFFSSILFLHEKIKNVKINNINILFHDTKAKSTTVEALPTIIENYLARGYRFEAINDNSFVPHQGINN